MVLTRAAATLALASVLAASAGCGSSTTTSTAPSPLVRCSLALNVDNQTLPATGGTGTVAVAAARECTWTVTVEGTWLSLRSDHSGQGDGTVQFAAASNPDPVMRRGALILNGQRAEITQTAALCDITLAGSSASFTPAGGSGRVDVRASSALCTWSTSADQPWISIRSGAEGRGSGAVLFDVAATSGPPRTGTITVAGQRFSVLQAEGCTYTISPDTYSAPASGDSGAVIVNTTAGCPWTAGSNVPWITISPATDSGPGRASFNVASTTGPSRTGTAVIAGHMFTVSQGQGCFYIVEPTSHAVAAAGGTASVGVNAASGCDWSASSDVPWISILSGTPNSGVGTVSFSVAATTGTARTGTLNVAGQRVTVTQAQGCTYAVSPTQESIAAGGGTGSVTVTAGDGCGWNAVSDVTWISIQSGASGSGNGTVNYSVAATSGPARSGTLTVAGQRVTILQGQGCTLTLAPTNANVADAGGTTSFDVQTSAGCSWTATSQAEWISIRAGGSGSGNGTVQLTVAANTGPARSGTVTVGEKTFTVTQGSGCSYALSSAGQSVPSAGGTGSVQVSAPAGCGWSAVSNASWLSITSGGTGTGDGTVSFAAAPNSGSSRTGTLTIAGNTFTVTQGDACTFAIAPTQQSVSAAGGSSTVNVTTATGCAWSATANVPWISVTSAPAGTGSGAVQLAIAANAGPARTGTATIAGRTFTVNQAAPCTYTVAPETIAAPAAGSAERVDVTTASDCAWTATTSTPWIAISNGATGTGNGRVDFTVAPNTGPARTGTVTIGGRTVTVNQASGCTYTINPTSAMVPATGTVQAVMVTTAAGCTWTSSSQASWIVVTSGASGTGSGTVQLTIQPNTSGAQRMGTATIANQTFTVTQLR